MKTSWLALAVISVLAVSLPVVSFAQTEARATLTGNLTDPSGAAIPNVTINAIKYEEPQKNKNVAAKTQSDAAGHFSLTLAPGRYRIVVSAPSFARTEEIVTLVAGESRELNAKLALEKLAASVVVTAAAEPTLATDSSAPVDVVTKDDIAQLDAMWLAPVIASESGAALSRLGPEGGVTTYFLDGGDSNFTKFLVDGIPMNEPGGAIELENYSLQSVDKIEIVHGASSALFGSDAVDGVVQIFSHRGTTTAPELELTGEGGTFRNGLGQRAIERSRGAVRLFRVGRLFCDWRPGTERLFSRCAFRWKFRLEILGHGHAAIDGARGGKRWGRAWADDFPSAKSHRSRRPA